MTALGALMICCFFMVSTAKADSPTEEAPMFCANIEWSPQGYIVEGTFTEFPPDISRAETLYSLDGETYQTSGEEWNITEWSAGLWTDWNEDELEKFQNQVCLHSNSEPLKSYLAGELDRFYVKLFLTRENGMTYETQAAVIDRGSPRPVPEGMTLAANFAPSIRVRTYWPFSCYGRYQITVSEDATPEEISAFLPDTLPIEVNLQNGLDHVASGIVDCPVTWKPLSSLELTAGESVTLPDAAEEIVIPGGTMLSTPLGIFQLDESLGINQPGRTDEVRLVLNVAAKDSSPSGALARENGGLQIVFHQKPTGATAIRVYTYSDNETEWTELPGIPLLQAVNAQPSTPNSGYTYVLGNDQEPYQSYLAAEAEGREPSPFFIGLKIEGGVYDSQKLILAWPDTYELPLDLPEPGGSGGNEGNAGADNKGDGTVEGQRPNLPVPDSSREKEDSGTAAGQQTVLPDFDGSGGNGGSDGTDEGQRLDLPQDTVVKDTLPSAGKPKNENLQNQGNTSMAGKTDAYAQSPMAAQAAAGTIAEAGYPTADTNTEAGASAADSSENTETNAQTKNLTPTPRSAQNSGSADPVPSGKEEKSWLNSENSSRKFLLLILAALAAGLCITGISIAVVAGKAGINSKF